jgi:hypothetical protein
MPRRLSFRSGAQRDLGFCFVQTQSRATILANAHLSRFTKEGELLLVQVRLQNLSRRHGHRCVRDVEEAGAAGKLQPHLD